MKHGKRPTVAQRKLMEANGLNSAEWLVVKDLPDRMELVHRHFKKGTKWVSKEALHGTN